MKQYQHLYRNMNLSDYVRVYDNVITPEHCQSLIDSFQAAQDQQILRDNAQQYFTEINLNQNDWYMNDLYASVLDIRQRYWSDVGITQQMVNGQHDFEQFKMRHWNAARGDQCQPQVAVNNYNQARRFLCCIWNLNQVDVGGETVFLRLDQELTIPARAGQVLIFPATWQYLYAETPALSDDRYSVHSYFHYS